MKKSSDQYPDYLSICIKKATMGFEPMIRVLQTLAFPLGHVATMKSKKRAGDGTRTHDLLLGKETFYQLNHARINTR